MSAASMESGERRRSTRLTSKRAAKEDEESPSQVKRRKTNPSKGSDSPVVKSATKGLVPTVVIDVAARPAAVGDSPLPEGSGRAHKQELDVQTTTVPSGLDVLSSSSTATTGAEPAQAPSKKQRSRRSKNKSRSSQKKTSNVNGDDDDDDENETHQEGLAADTDQVPSALDALSSTTKESRKKSFEPASKKSSHVRFGSEEPLPLGLPAQPKAALVQEPGEASEAEDSDDGAPEDISASAAQVQSKALAAEQTKAIAEQKANTKRKRRRTAQHLQEQAEASKAKSLTSSSKQKEFSTDATSDPEASDADAEEDIVGSTEQSAHLAEEAPLPDFLPTELLNRRDTMSPSPPPRETMKNKGLLPTTALQGKGRLTKFSNDGPQDIRVGPVNVRVMQAANPRLAVRGDSKAASVRQSWLAGRANGVGGGVQRQKVGRGFLRR